MISEGKCEAVQYLIRIPAHGACSAAALTQDTVTPDVLAAMLDTDVTERMRLPVTPEAFADEPSVLCYFIDARGGERDLPVNFCGTCFYHTGCPIHGDLLLARCEQDADSAAVSGFTAEEAQCLIDWLHTQFPEYLSAE